MKWFAKALLWWTPGFAKLRACREVSGDFTAILAEALQANPGAGLEAFREAARETGRKSALRMKDELGLDDSFEDVEFAWKLICKISGMKIAVTREDGRSVFRHLSCPLHRSGGKRLCESFCLPMVEGLTRALSSSMGVALVEEATDSRPCRKALTRGGDDAA